MVSISCFRPLIGDYFFIALKNALTLHDLTNVFPSPCWGLFFYLQYDEKLEEIFNYVDVSVPVLGIIFLSLPSIVMITSAFKLWLSAESL